MSHIINGGSQVDAEKLTGLLDRLECRAIDYHNAPVDSERESAAYAECDRLKQEILGQLAGEPITREWFMKHPNYNGMQDAITHSWFSISWRDGESRLVLWVGGSWYPLNHIKTCDQLESVLQGLGLVGQPLEEARIQ